MTKEQLDEIINNSEFSECIKDAAPHRVKIIKDIGPKIKELKDDFKQEMINANWGGIGSINDKLKLDKKDAQANAEYKEWNKKVMNLFQATLKAIHPNENQKPTIGQIYVAGKLLNYIGRNDIVQGVMEDKNVSLTFKKLEDVNKYFDSQDVRDVMVDIFKQADETQQQMCENADKIKYDYYDMLPPEVKFDAKMNKGGIKQNHFCTLVRHKAMSIIKDADKYTKYLNAQIEANNNNIGREEIMIGKTKQM